MTLSSNIINVSNLYPEVLYKFTIMLIDNLSKIDETVAQLSNNVKEDEILETLVIPPIATVFILNECIHYDKFHPFEIDNFPNSEEIDKITQKSYEKYYNYMTLFNSSKKSASPVEGKLVS